MRTPMPATVVALERSDRADAVTVLTEAFHREPWLRWTFAGRRDEPEAMLRALMAFSVDVRYAMGWPLYGARVEGRLVGVVGVTIPGGEWPDALNGAYAELCQMVGPEATERLEKVATLEHAHRPAAQNYEVGVLGVHPAAQRRGLGRRLLAAVHAVARQAPATTGVYLATTDPANVPFYRRAGYDVLAEAPVAPSVGFWAMFRSHDRP